MDFVVDEIYTLTNIRKSIEKFVWLFMYLIRNGCVIRTIDVPGQVVGSVAWGGRNREILFVSTGTYYVYYSHLEFNLFNKNFVYVTNKQVMCRVIFSAESIYPVMF